jgi:fumarate reductase subunit D
LGLKTATGAKLICYGVALLGTALAAYSLLVIGF